VVMPLSITAWRPHRMKHRTNFLSMTTTRAEDDPPDFQVLQSEALKVKSLYDDMNLKQRTRTWTNEEFMLGFVGDVGDLAKLVMAQEGAREVPGGRAALAHELADCLWSVLVLSHLYDVDLVHEFQSTMDKISTQIQSAISG
jgi:NTP pyrophosphatase (non-canonical NTP hydrolase)